jgi:hypothetical protein
MPVDLQNLGFPPMSPSWDSVKIWPAAPVFLPTMSPESEINGTALHLENTDVKPDKTLSESRILVADKEAPLTSDRKPSLLT